VVDFLGDRLWRDRGSFEKYFHIELDDISGTYTERMILAGGGGEVVTDSTKVFHGNYCHI
jgi:hypothetical protein